MTTGQRMKLRRRELKKSAEEIAKILGVSPATIYRYEKGDIEKVPGDFLEPLAKALDTTPAWLMGWEEPQQTKKSPAKPAEDNPVTFDDFTYAMYGHSKELTEDEKKMLLEMAEFMKKKRGL